MARGALLLSTLVCAIISLHWAVAYAGEQAGGPDELVKSALSQLAGRGSSSRYIDEACGLLRQCTEPRVPLIEYHRNIGLAMQNPLVSRMTVPLRVLRMPTSISIGQSSGSVFPPE